MKKYFKITWLDESGESCVAEAPDEFLDEEVLEDQLSTMVSLPFVFTLVNCPAEDYLPNNMAWPLMSVRMKSIVEQHLSGYEKIIWVKAIVKTGKENLDYFIPRFTEKLDVLDLNKTSFVKGTDAIIKPVFSYAKIMNYSLFHIPRTYIWQISASLLVNESLKNAIENAEITGCVFEPRIIAP